MPPTRLAALALVVVASGCAPDASAPRPAVPGSLRSVTAAPVSGAVGSTLASPFVVSVSDSGGNALSGVPVLFAVTVGNGSVSPQSATTGPDGRAQTSITLGTIAGSNEVTASVRGVSAPVRTTTTGVPGSANSVTLGPRPVRFPIGTDSVRVTSVALDAFGNRTSDHLSLIVRDTTLVTLDANGYVHVRRRGGSTYIVGLTAGSGDSVIAVALATGDSPCSAVATARTLAVGEVATDLQSGVICVRAGGADEEYALAPYFNSASPAASLQVAVQGNGIVGVADTLPIASPLTARTPNAWNDALPARFDANLRRIEAREMPARAAAARAWHNTARLATAAGTARAPGTPSYGAVPANVAMGDLVTLNANAFDYCANPRMRTARVVALSEHAVVVADTSNPGGGFSDAEFRSFAVTFDTLVHPVDVGAFGEPSDIDGNARVVMFFTRAVNELTPRGSAAVILGFYFSRDLLPRTSASGNCPGSNVAEMFYLLVPDETGLTSDARSKDFVRGYSNGTVAHEYQHLINASRRLYVNHAPATDEEVWLNEGLSHVAEELVFYRSAGLQPRQNLGAGVLANSATADAFQQFGTANLRRYGVYLRSTNTQAPTGIAGDDDLETRGAIWSFLRYAADRTSSSGSDGSFWFQLVNSTTTGLANIANVIGQDPAPFLRDWSTSVFADDAAPGIDPRFQQRSWNFRSLLPALGTAFPLTDPASDHRLVDGLPSTMTMRGGGVSFFRFGVAANTEALLLVSSGGQPAPSIQLSLVRVR